MSVTSPASYDRWEPAAAIPPQADLDAIGVVRALPDAIRPA
jgi:hypothetical protein